MATQPTMTRTPVQRSLPIVIGLTVLVLLLMFSIVSLRVRTPSTASSPAAPVAVADAPDAMTHRFFADEIAGAANIDLVTAASGMLPDRNERQAQVVAPGVAWQAPRPITNRFFADEIAGAGAQDLTTATSGVQPGWDRPTSPR